MILKTYEYGDGGDSQYIWLIFKHVNLKFLPRLRGLCPTDGLNVAWENKYLSAAEASACTIVINIFAC